MIDNAASLTNILPLDDEGAHNLISKFQKLDFSNSLSENVSKLLLGLYIH